MYLNRLIDIFTQYQPICSYCKLRSRKFEDSADTSSGFGLVAISVWEIFAVKNEFHFVGNMKATLLRNNTNEHKSDNATEIEPH